MNRLSPNGTRPDRGQRGQIIVIAALALITFIGGVSLVIEGGNAYAHQRVAQNAADSVANAGATILAQRLGGGTQTDADVDGGHGRHVHRERPRLPTPAGTPT